MTRGTIFLVICILVGTAFLTSLGFWQMKRLAWKETLIGRVEAGLKKPPVRIDQIESVLEGGDDIEYRPAKATGVFLHDHEAHYFATHKSRPGFFIYTPLQLESGRLLLVNRGYVPMESKPVSKRLEGLVEGEVTVTGLARSAPKEKPNWNVPDNDLAKNIFYWKSLHEMAGLSLDETKHSFLPFFLDADDSPVPGNLPVGGVTLIQFPNNHLQYALTWFGLAGALLVVGAAFLRSRYTEAMDGGN